MNIFLNLMDPSKSVFPIVLTGVVMLAGGIYFYMARPERFKAFLIASISAATLGVLAMVLFTSPPATTPTTSNISGTAWSLTGGSEIVTPVVASDQLATK